ncbi:hypothetical protein [Novosphingobium sp. CECT 9465]|uniref:hypothetical protein n=1 Tax=Novosphingobium sp. CECT 9465 TaxID=2829794 RepID=UPI001E5E9BDC|nr:hypothetical protein [Novosphingobium sp. CECT 9465]CAH0496422.1 hypothetical protein NVSP9465_01456 [Novosphingobium sp. CECT 9465]
MLKILIAAGVGALLAATPAFGEDWDFVLVNATGKRITDVEVAPAASARWQMQKRDPELKRMPFPAGARQNISFDRDANVCLFDIRIKFADGTMGLWSRINVCDNSYVTIRYTNGAPSFVGN